MNTTTNQKFFSLFIKYQKKMAQEVRISLAQVEALLNEGKDRKEIRVALGLSHAQVQDLFQHPVLKNRKPRRAGKVVLVDDTGSEIPSPSGTTTEEPTTDVTPEVATEVAEKTVEEAPVEAVTETVTEVVPETVPEATPEETPVSPEEIDDWTNNHF
jgi:hypothetical protein